jgi:mannose-6-phosphate isomerase-like protein (cupin superfamily)
MNDIAKVLEKIKGNQATISVLLEKGSISFNKPSEDKWDINTIYEDDGVTIGFATCSNVGGDFPEHLHDNVQEYLLCVNGSFIISFGPNGADGVRIVKERECVSVPPNTLHTSRPLSKNTRNIYVCIPRDKAIKEPK